MVIVAILEYATKSLRKKVTWIGIDVPFYERAVCIIRNNKVQWYPKTHSAASGYSIKICFTSFGVERLDPYPDS